MLLLFLQMYFDWLCILLFCTMHYFFFYLLIYFLLSVCDVKKLFNPLSPNGDQHQFSANNIYMLPRGMVMRVNKMITKEKKF